MASPSSRMREPREPRGPEGFGRASFVVLALFFVARVGAVFLPCSSWGPSGYLCSVPYLLLPLGEAHTSIAAKAYGESARISNRLDFVSFRSEKFTVDERGYRNPPTPGLEHPKALLIGSSFSVGMALNDEDTFAAQVNRQLGPVLYNAARWLDPSLSAYRVRESFASLGMRDGWVFLEMINRAPYTYDPSPPPDSFRMLGPYQNGVRQAYQRFSIPLRSFSAHFLVPFSIMRISSMLNMRLHNDVLLPNMYKDKCSEEELINGEHMLFFFRDKEFAQSRESAAGTAEAAVELRDQLARDGFKLGVVLVPTGYTAYFPLLKNAQGNDFGKQYITDLEGLLAKNGVPVFNCLPVLRKAAKDELAAGRLVYWRDDAHWNPDGCGTAARAVAPWIRNLIDQGQGAQ